MSTEMNTSDIFHSMIPDEIREQIEVKSMTDDEYAQQQCDWYNESEGSLGEIDCPDCKNRGYFQYIDSEKCVRMRECKCIAQRKYIAAMKAAGLGELYEKCTFDTFTVKTDWQRTCKALAWRYAAQDDNTWLLFSGQSGCGKTHLCTAVCSELAKRGRRIRYVQWKRLYDRLVQTKFKLYEHDDIFNDCIKADVLYLDDFLKMPHNAMPTDDMLSYALEIIDARYKADKKTILSTEFFSDDLIKFDEALGGRIKEKTKNNKIQIEKKDGRNYRKADVKDA